MQEGIMAARGTRVICPGCGTRYAVTTEYYGRTFPCEKCQEDLLVPDYKGRTDARPILRRDEGVIWAKIEQERDRLYQMLQKACEKFELDAHVLRSAPYEYPAKVTFECWAPRGHALVTERSSLVITINPAPFCRFDVLYDVSVHRSQGMGAAAQPVTLSFGGWFLLFCLVCPPLFLLPLSYYAYRLIVWRGGKLKSFTGLRELPPEDIEGLIGFVLHKGWCPYLSKYAVRKHWWQLWRPRNIIEALMWDWLAILDAALVALGFGVFGYIWSHPQHNKWEFLAYSSWAGALGLWIYLKMRPRLVRSSGKPTQEPRTLMPGDNWHFVLFGAGKNAPTLKATFEEALKENTHEKMKYWTEKNWCRGLDDIEEREQSVVSFGRALVYCQIYQYHDDLYVGWDAYLNEAQWVETSREKGLDRECGLPVTIAVAVPGRQPPSEYDRADLHLATEWVHARLCKLVKRLIADQGIDQEIDFRPVRSEHPASAAPPPRRGVAGKLMNLFRRKA
jgi:hypothetical protein